MHHSVCQAVRHEIERTPVYIAPGLIVRLDIFSMCRNVVRPQSGVGNGRHKRVILDLVLLVLFDYMDLEILIVELHLIV